MAGVILDRERIHPYDPRLTPAPVPGAGVFSSPRVTVNLNRRWASHINGLLERFLYQDAWIGTEVQRIAAVQEVEKLLIALANGVDESFADCDDYALFAQNITFAPRDPYSQPNDVPQGYLRPPLGLIGNDPILDAPLILLGYQPGDIFTEISRFPTGSLPTVVPPDGFPRLRITFEDAAEIELHLLKMPLGGLVLITVDDDPLTSQLNDLNLDLISVPPEVGIQIVKEVQVTTPGQHHVDVTFLPFVNDELPLVRHGGGIRKVVICQAPDITLRDIYGGSPPSIEVILEDYFEEYGVYPMVLEDIRVTGGQVEKKMVGGAWSNVPNGEFVRRDASLDPDIAGATRITGEIQTPSVVYGDLTSSRQWRFGVVSAELRLQHAINFSSAPFTVGANPAAQGIRIDDIFRSRIAFAHQRQTSLSLWRDAARMDAGWDEATDATRRGMLALSVHDASAAREIIRGGTTGTAPRVGFLGATPIARPTITGADNGNEALRNLIAAMTNYGLINNATTQTDIPDVSGGEARCRVALGVPRLFMQAAKRLIDAHVAAEPLNLFDDAAYLSIVRAYGVPWRNETVVKEWLQNHDLNCPDQGDPPFVDCALLWDALESAAANPNLESQMAARLLSVMPDDGYLTEGTITAWNAALDTLTGTVARVRYFFRILIEFTDPIAWGSWANTANGFAFSDCRELDVSIEFVGAGTTTTEGQTLNLPVRLNAPAGFALNRALTFRIVHDPFPAATGDALDIFIQPGATFAFPAGAANGATTNATVQIVDDVVPEPNESVRVRLEDNSYGTVGTASTHLITILGDDEYPDCGETITIDFENGVPGYALVPAQHLGYGVGAGGQYSASGGRTAPGAFTSTGTIVQFEIDLGKECSVRYVSFWRRTSSYAGGNNFPVGLNMWSASGAHVYSNNTARGSGDWSLWEFGFSFSGTLAENVRYITITSFTLPELAPIYLDDITIILL